MVTHSAVGLTSARRRRPSWVAGLMLAGVVILLGALWSGLVHLGLPLPSGGTSLHQGHGPMMILGFLGTVIALERAVALGSTWAYLGPAAAGAGGLCVLLGVPDGIPQLLIIVGGVVLVAVFVVVDRIQRSLHNFVLAAGAVCWVAAGCLWLSGWQVFGFIPWMAGFLVLTITGERLELSRLGGASATARRLFIASAVVFAAGLAWSTVDEPTGVRVAGVGMLALAAWLGRYDIARRTVRTTGLTRYMAVALLTGYGWLAVSGILWIVFGTMSPTSLRPSAYDAMLHTLFLGFVISMIFAHAAIIVPSVIGRPLQYHPVSYLPLALLHVSLLIRVIGGDALGNTAVWRWGGIFNEVAFLLFMVLTMYNLFLRSRSARKSAGKSPSAHTQSSP